MDHTDPVLLPGAPDAGGDATREERLTAKVAAAIASTRIQRGLSLEDAAAAAGIDPVALAEAEAGERALAQEELARLAGAYGVELTAFFGGKETPISFLAGF